MWLIRAMWTDISKWYPLLVYNGRNHRLSVWKRYEKLQNPPFKTSKSMQHTQTMPRRRTLALGEKAEGAANEKQGWWIGWNSVQTRLMGIKQEQNHLYKLSGLAGRSLQVTRQSVSDGLYPLWSRWPPIHQSFGCSLSPRGLAPRWIRPRPPLSSASCRSS